jgi:ATPase subunit of ABC transporter with duplicated ATPase domains
MESASRWLVGSSRKAARIASNLGLDDRVLSQPLKNLSGGQRRRVELARILFS